MIRKHLKKSTAFTIAICTLITWHTINIDGKEKINNIKQCLKYIIPGSFALVTGYILGNAYNDRLEQSNWLKKNNIEKYNKILESIEDLKDFRNLPNWELNAYIDEMINNPLQYAKFGSFKRNKVLIFRKFYEENTLDKAWFLEELQKGTTMVFLGNIINDKKDNGISLRNLIFLTTLQKLYPDNVIILKGINEINRSYSDKLPISISSYIKDHGIYNKSTTSQIRSLLDNFMCACEVSYEGLDGEKFRCLFSHCPVRFKMTGKETKRRQRSQLTRQNFIDDDFEEGDFIYSDNGFALKELDKFLKNEGYEQAFYSTSGHKLEMIYLNDLLRHKV